MDDRYKNSITDICRKRWHYSNFEIDQLLNRLNEYKNNNDIFEMFEDMHDNFKTENDFFIFIDKVSQINNSELENALNELNRKFKDSIELR